MIGFLEKHFGDVDGEIFSVLLKYEEIVYYNLFYVASK